MARQMEVGKEEMQEMEGVEEKIGGQLCGLDIFLALILIGRRTDGRKDRRTNGWTDGRMDGWTD